MAANFTIKMSALFLSGLLVACQGSEFNGTSAKSAPMQTQDQEPEPVEPVGDPVPVSLTEVFPVEESSTPVDIIFAVDSSGSMNNEIVYVQENMKDFVQALLKANIDAQINLVGKFTFDSSAIPAERFAHLKNTIGSNNAIGIMNGIFSASSSDLKLRDNAGLEMVFVTDDNGKGAANIATAFKAPAGKKTVVNGIVGLKKGKSATNAQCSIDYVGDEYITLAKQTNGTIFDLCDKDWSGLFKQLSERIIVRNRGYVLTDKLDSNKEWKVEVDGHEIDKDKVSYDEASNKIILAADVAIEAGQKISVHFHSK